ncbi:hypothetical protein Mapa_007930 [Marchantia paleacea]|nr:hypothetical protein Mapa_007930 [Marchantia paleacea]
MVSSSHFVALGCVHLRDLVCLFMIFSALVILPSVKIAFTFLIFLVILSSVKTASTLSLFFFLEICCGSSLLNTKFVLVPR